MNEETFSKPLDNLSGASVRGDAYDPNSDAWGGAAVAWMRPDEIDGLLAASKSESATRQYGRVYAKQYDPDMVPVCGAAVRGEPWEFDLTLGLPERAAVRGEAVAEERWCLACDKAGHRTDECWSTYATNTPQARELMRLCHASVTSEVSARAADAPSEPSEPDMLWLADDGEFYASGADDFANDYAQNLAPGDEVEIGVDCAVRAHSRKMRIKLIDNGDDDNTVEWEWVGIKSRAADALDSQPTESKGE